MADIHELNRRRAEASEYAKNLGYSNTPDKLGDRLIADAQYRLAADAAMRAEAEYQAAMRAMTTDELIALARSTSSPTETPPPEPPSA